MIDLFKKLVKSMVIDTNKIIVKFKNGTIMEIDKYGNITYKYFVNRRS
jgi:hypothetical protein